MSANPEIPQNPELIAPPAPATALPQAENSGRTNDWNPADFAREQIRNLVRQVFFGDAARPVKQVVFSAVEPGAEIARICDQVGLALASETQAHVAIVGRDPRVAAIARPRPHYVGFSPIKSLSAQVKTNLWRVQEFRLSELGEESGTGRYWLSYLAQLRNEFEYTVIQGPVAGMSSEAVLLAQLSDGIILVLGAHNTRRATARKIKETLESTPCRILGTVLSDRTFPMPERIYRRL